MPSRPIRVPVKIRRDDFLKLKGVQGTRHIVPSSSGASGHAVCNSFLADPD